MTDESKNSSSPLPPLRIYHFLVWMTVAAVTIAAARASIGRDHFLALSNGTPSFFLEYLVASLATTVCGFVLYWRFRTVNFAWEPGQGFLLQQAATLILRMFGSVLFGLYLREIVTGTGTTTLASAPIFVQWFVGWSPHLYDLLNLAIFLFSALLVAPHGVWCVLFSLLTVFAVLNLAWSGLLYQLLPSLSFSGLERAEMVSNILFYIPNLLGMILLVALSWREERIGISRHWTHWCGVGCFLTSALLAIGSQLWYDFFAESWSSYPPASTTP